VKGSGTEIQEGDVLSVRLSPKETLDADPSLTSEPLSFVYGKGEIPLAMEIGMRNMHIGGYRRLYVPPELNPNVLIKNKSIVFDVEVLGKSECLEKKALGFVTYRECA